jgi:hypothetical protein
MLRIGVESATWVKDVAQIPGVFDKRDEGPLKECMGMDLKFPAVRGKEGDLGYLWVDGQALALCPFGDCDHVAV